MSDGVLFKGNIEEGSYRLIKTTDGWVLVGKDIVFAGSDITDRPQGEWVPFEYGDERWHKCTACGVADRYIEYVERPNGTTGKLVAIRNYCPNCGARMFAKDTNVPNKKGADE